MIPSDSFLAAKGNRHPSWSLSGGMCEIEGVVGRKNKAEDPLEVVEKEALSCRLFDAPLTQLQESHVCGLCHKGKVSAFLSFVLL